MGEIQNPLDLGRKTGSLTANPLDKHCFLAPGAGSGPGFFFYEG